MAAGFPWRDLNTISRCCGHFHISNKDLLANCKEHINVIRIFFKITFMFLLWTSVYRLTQRNVSARGMRSHMTTSCTSSWSVTAWSKKIKTPFYINRKATLACTTTYWKTITNPAFKRRESEAYFTVATCWLDTSAPDGNLTEGKRWEEPSGTVLQTLKDENIENLDTTHLQQPNILMYTVDGHGLLGFYVFLVN